jgi:hypothetical protein
MAMRSPHGRAKTHGAPGPRIEVLPPKELPAPVPDPQGDAARAIPRGPRGHFTREAAVALGALGGKASKGKRASLATTLGMGREIAPTAAAFAPYRRRATSFRRAHAAELASLAGGECGTGPSAMVATASLQLAVSRYLYDLGTKGKRPNLNVLKEARAQADSSRQNLLAAYELAIREGKARGQNRGALDIDAVTRRAEEDTARRRDARRQVIDAPSESAPA